MATASGSSGKARSAGEGVAFLADLGQRVRSARAKRGMSRKILARDSGVSERYLAQLESGRGNVSVLVLREIAMAMAMPVGVLLSEGGSAGTTRAELVRLLDALGDGEIEGLVAELRRRAGTAGAAVADGRGRRIGLVGLRGGGKSTLGKALAEHLKVPFIELNRIVEAEFGGTLDELFSHGGQPAYRRYERRCLERVLSAYDAAVIATGGGIVANDGAYAALIERTHTIWIQTSPEEHMERVIAQGDMRPMADNREAMRDLRQILSAREPAYGRAESRLDTSRRSVAESTRALVALARALIAGRLAAE